MKCVFLTVFAVAVFVNIRAISISSSNGITLVDLKDEPSQRIILTNIRGLSRPLEIQNGIVREMSEQEAQEFAQQQAQQAKQFEEQMARTQQEFEQSMRYMQLGFDYQREYLGNLWRSLARARR
ncbi:hypothetical protein BIW11_04499 [Tropilaelaps mercedesae]|uniref:Uncharacterized protein n=1 Tax=Tropilaelaps mercedesae TaxID=418985 RepID=A0A1V9X5U1_9ACAR|nr:hypothetical protein BIW11_04499 [Tropilaelaps mercedesae]